MVSAKFAIGAPDFLLSDCVIADAMRTGNLEQKKYREKKNLRRLQSYPSQIRAQHVRCRHERMPFWLTFLPFFVVLRQTV